MVRLFFLGGGEGEARSGSEGESRDTGTEGRRAAAAVGRVGWVQPHTATAASNTKAAPRAGAVLRRGRGGVVESALIGRSDKN